MICKEQLGFAALTQRIVCAAFFGAWGGTRAVDEGGEKLSQDGSDRDPRGEDDGGVHALGPFGSGIQ
jgi:hypothetical protein